MAVVQRLCRDLADALHRAGHGGAGGAGVVQRLHQPLVHLPFRIVLDHVDLLGNDALLLLHALLGEVGHGHEGQQNLQILVEFLRGVEVVAGDGVGRKGVGLRAVFRQLLQGVARLGVEHLVLQIVGDAGGGVQPLAVQLKAHIHAAVAGGEHGVLAAIVLLGDDEHRQAVFQRCANDLLADAGIDGLFGMCHVTPPPFRAGSTRCPAWRTGPPP